LLGGSLNGMASYGLPHGVKQDLAGSAEESADDDPFGVDEVAEARYGHSDLVAGVGEGPMAPELAGDGKLDDAGQRRHLAIQRSNELEDGRTGRHCLEAARVPAVAKGSRLIEGGVSDLAGSAGGAVQQLAVDHE